MNLRAEQVPVWLMALTCLLACRGTLRAYDWQPPPGKITVLAVCAHPDDEGIFFGGALTYYSSVLRLPTMLVCMTSGWGSVRDDELRCAAWTYGLRYDPIFGRFDDRNTGTYTNTPYGTNTIDMYWDLWADGVLQ